MTKKEMINTLMNILVKAELTARQYDQLMSVIKALGEYDGSKDRN